MKRKIKKSSEIIRKHSPLARSGRVRNHYTKKQDKKINTRKKPNGRAKKRKAFNRLLNNCRNNTFLHDNGSKEGRGQGSPNNGKGPKEGRKAYRKLGAFGDFGVVLKPLRRIGEAERAICRKYYPASGVVLPVCSRLWRRFIPENEEDGKMWKYFHRSHHQSKKGNVLNRTQNRILKRLEINPERYAQPA